jgi:hypothetical protein
MRVPAWQGDWETRIYDRVRQLDFATLTAFADARPTATLEQLARELGPEKDIAPVQVEWLLRHEAQETQRVHRFARSALVRQVHEVFPRGWMRGERAEWNRILVGAEWITALGEERRAAAERVWDSLMKIASIGWLPSSPDDPILVQAFREGRFQEDGPGEKGETGGPP